MTKIMLVEDDNNLREIYEARLAAEGYSIVSAQDGEAALALAAKERPDLIITDVMMPKISGFEMLDILRNTEGLRDVKVIMLTALGQAEDNARAGALGADRYLVKSQVTLEDIVKAAHDVSDNNNIEPDADAATAGMTASAADTGSQPHDDRQDGLAWQSPPPAPAAPNDSVPTPAPAVDDTQAVVPEVVDQPVETPSPVASPAAPPADPAPAATEADRPVEAEQAAVAESAAESATDEESDMRAQIDEFIGNGATVNIREDSHVLPDEPDAEYDRDAQTPDMGQLSVHAGQPPAAPEQPANPNPNPAPAPSEQPALSPTPPPSQQPVPPPTQTPAIEQPAAAPQPPSPAAGYPSQPFSLPVPPEATIDPAAVPSSAPAAPAQPAAAPSSDAVVSNAINDMISQTTSGTAGGPPPTQPGATSAAAADTPAGSVHNRIIAPLGQPLRPDIHQLLSVEEAKAAAAQAQANGGVPAPGQSNQSVQTQPAPYQPPQYPSNNNQPIDPNSISL